MHKAVCWIHLCLVLHNLVIRLELLHGNDLTVDASWRRAMQELGATVDEQGRAAADWETGVEDNGP